jgi:POT family proton-dependent oligopeptide transporter
MKVSYYGCQGLFQNYISHRSNGADGAPGLGLGHQGATGLNLFFQWFCYGMSQHHETRQKPY